jgi:DNA-binding MarR family transcriptional regulator
VVLVGLTDAGREMIDRPWETRRAVLASALREASPDERAAIERGLILLVDALEKAEKIDMMNGVERA